MAFEWQAEEADDAGVDEGALNAMAADLATRGTQGLLVSKDDRIVLEWYGDDHGPDKPHYSASLAKAMVGGVSLMLAMDDGLIDPDDLASKFVPTWANDPRRSKITIRHLATHSSGVEDAELNEADRKKALLEGVPLTDHHMSLPGWKGAFWRQEPDPFTLSRDDAPIEFEPGNRYAYSNPGMAMLAWCVTESLKDSPHRDIRTLLADRLMRPMGLADDTWSVGYGKTFDVDGLPLVANWGGGGFTARTAAAVGRLMLRRGDWEGESLVRRETVERMVAYAETPIPDRPDGNPQPASGLAWYTNYDLNWAGVPADAFAGAGAGNQVLIVVPSLQMIIVRNGSQIDEKGFWGGVVDHLLNPLIAAIRT